MTYKVIKPFDSAIKGDIFENTLDPFVFDMTREVKSTNGYCEVNMSIDSDTAKQLVNDGYLVEVNESCDNCDCCNKLAKVTSKVNELIETYTNDYEALLKEYNDGGVQPCVKVEAETVYHNLIKVLNEIKGLLDE